MCFFLGENMYLVRKHFCGEFIFVELCILVKICALVKTFFVFKNIFSLKKKNNFGEIYFLFVKTCLLVIFKLANYLFGDNFFLIRFFLKHGENMTFGEHIFFGEYGFLVNTCYFVKTYFVVHFCLFSKKCFVKNKISVENVFW